MKKVLAKLAIIAYNHCMHRASRLVCPVYILMEPTVGNDCNYKWVQYTSATSGSEKNKQNISKRRFFL